MSNRGNLYDFPKMVRWFTPLLLLHAAFRDMVSRLFGQYADQRISQHLADTIPKLEDDRCKFSCRYDYSQEVMEGEPFWVDYTSDLGDGFDTTYAMAYLMSADLLSGKLKPGAQHSHHIHPVKDLGPNEDLRAGRILVMGGDQVYPWPSRDEYASRLQKPYELAFPPLPADPKTGKRPPAKRHVFAIPGNHDWYDGLGAFDDLFCRARSGNSGRESEFIGGWQTRQHRSYFAIKLPHNWWIWGADIQLNKYLDSGQLEYFRTISQQMGPQDKFVLCTAQPTWLYFGSEKEKYARENLRNLIDMPIRRGAKICAILSGDTHHYSRYNENSVLGNFNLIIAGGGGAYTHGTHDLKKEITFNWVGKDLKFRLNRFLKPQPTDSYGTSKPLMTGQYACYPGRFRSCLLALRNFLAFPFRNFTFCLAMGLIYWLLTWTFSELKVDFDFETQLSPLLKQQVLQQAQERKKEKAQQWRQQLKRFDEERRQTSPFGPDVDSIYRQEYRPDKMRDFITQMEEPINGQRQQQQQAQQAQQAQQQTPQQFPGQPGFSGQGQPQQPGQMPNQGSGQQPQQTQPQAQPQPNAKNDSEQPIGIWTIASIEVYLKGIAKVDLFSWQAFHLTWEFFLVGVTLLLLGISNSPLAAAFLFGIWGTFYGIAETHRRGKLKFLVKFISGSLHFGVHLFAMWGLYSLLIYWNHIYWKEKFDALAGDDQLIWRFPTPLLEKMMYPLEMIVIGGFMAGLIFGFYLLITYILRKVNSDWTFSALRLTSYKNFLRMRFEPNRLTIYPIGLDAVPRRRWWSLGWRWIKTPQPGKPNIEPKRPLSPRLIEGPIIINANEVSNIPRNI